MRLLWLVVIALGLHAADATIDIVKNMDLRPSISFVDASTLGDANAQKRFFNLLSGDFKVTAHFKVNDTYTRGSISDKPPASLGSDYVVVYRFFEKGDGGLYLNVRGYKGGGESIYRRSYKIKNRGRYPFLMHQAVIEFNDFLQMPSVAWMKRYVILSVYTKPRQSDILLADYTLTYQKRLISGGLNIFPKWADKQQRSIYYTNVGRNAQLYRYNIYSGKRTKVIASQGMMVCSDVTQDGKQLLLTMAPEGQPDIYLYNIETAKKQRLTDYSGIDVGGQFMYNGGDVVFVSDRMGYPNVYKLHIGQRGVEQMVYHGRNNNACSANRHYIVYSSRETDNSFSPNAFNLYMISTKSDYIRRLTANGRNQFPKFSEDGESLLFIKHFERQSALGILRINYNESFLFPLRGSTIQSIDW